MQFHLNGYEPGDPTIANTAKRRESSPGSRGRLRTQVDVLIVGCGPAGLTLAAQLAAFPDIKTCIVDQKPGPLMRGQADGIACRTMEMFQAFGFVDRVIKEAYWVNETSFWKPDDDARERIVRHGRIQDVEDGLSEYPHVILNQARVHDFYLDHMRNAPAAIEPYYDRCLTDLRIPAGQGEIAEHWPVEARFVRARKDGLEAPEIVRARYVVGCDGARSAVRSLIGRELHGESANQAWGVMDVLAVSDFPDIRLKALIQSADEGSIILIPREGGYLTRIYVEMDELAEHERVSARKISVDRLIAAAQRILRPYSFEVKEVAWWSVYEIGQRLCDRFDDLPDEDAAVRSPRVFIAGDACHTHSPKAGQGMNVSMQDSFNLGWKLAAVLQGRSPERLLNSYSDERHAIAQELIEFDREWAKMLAAPLKSSDRPDGIDPAEVQRYFVRQGRYTAGTATRYQPSELTGPPTHQTLAEGFGIGTRFHSAPVIRLADAKPVELGHAAEADGRWRIYIFADTEAPAPGSAAVALCDFLASDPSSPIRRYTAEGADIDAVIDVRAIFQQSHRTLDLSAMPRLLLPRKGKLGLIDYEKIFSPDFKNQADIFDLRAIDRRGCMVIVRPDQYVAHVLPLSDRTALTAFFDGFMIAR